MNFSSLLLSKISLSVYSNVSDVNHDFLETSDWLKVNLKGGQLVLVPRIEVFNSYVPSLSNSFIDYSKIWLSSGVVFGSNTSQRDVLSVRQFLFKYLQDTPQVVYVVVDDLYPPCYLLFNNSISDELSSVLVKEIEFPFFGGRFY